MVSTFGVRLYYYSRHEKTKSSQVHSRYMAEKPKPKTGKEILALVVTHLKHGKYYTVSEIFDLLNAAGVFSDADLEENNSGESKAYRRLNNALRDGAVQGTIQKNEDPARFQYRVSP